MLLIQKRWILPSNQAETTTQQAHLRRTVCRRVELPRIGGLETQSQQQPEIETISVRTWPPVHCPEISNAQRGNGKTRSPKRKSPAPPWHPKHPQRAHLLRRRPPPRSETAIRSSSSRLLLIFGKRASPSTPRAPRGLPNPSRANPKNNFGNNGAAGRSAFWNPNHANQNAFWFWKAL